MPENPLGIDAPDAAGVPGADDRPDAVVAPDALDPPDAELETDPDRARAQPPPCEAPDSCDMGDGYDGAVDEWVAVAAGVIRSPANACSVEASTTCA